MPPNDLACRSHRARSCSVQSSSRWATASLRASSRRRCHCVGRTPSDCPCASKRAAAYSWRRRRRGRGERSAGAHLEYERQRHTKAYPTHLTALSPGNATSHTLCSQNRRPLAPWNHRTLGRRAWTDSFERPRGSFCVHVVMQRRCVMMALCACCAMMCVARREALSCSP
jgi:hypothetical protein